MTGAMRWARTWQCWRSKSRCLTRCTGFRIADQGYPFLVVVDHTNMRSTTEYGGRHLLYIGNYLPMSHRYFTQPDEETLAEFMPSLEEAQPEFDESWIEEKWVFKAPFAQPIVTREYAAHIPPLKTPLPNVYMGNMFQVYPQDGVKTTASGSGRRSPN